jgi:hypothetical protein
MLPSLSSPPQLPRTSRPPPHSYCFSTLDTVTLPPSSIFRARLSPHSCAILPRAWASIRRLRSRRLGTRLPDARRTTHDTLDGGGMERRGGGWWEVGGGDEVILRSATRAQARARSACDTRYGYGARIRYGVGGGIHTHSRHNPTRPDLRVRRVHPPSIPLSPHPSSMVDPPTPAHSQAADPLPAPAYLGGAGFRGAGHG